MVKTAIHCKTKEEFKRVLEIFDKKGWKWITGNEPLEDVNYWNYYKEETCIRYEDDFQYTNKEWYLGEGYKIISFEEFLKIEGIEKHTKMYQDVPSEIITKEMILNFKEQMK